MTDEKKTSQIVRWEAKEYIQHDKNAGWASTRCIISLATVVDFYRSSDSISSCALDLCSTSSANP